MEIYTISVLTTVQVVEHLAALLFLACSASKQTSPSSFQYGDTSLHTACRYGHAGVTRILISARCRVNEQNKVRRDLRKMQNQEKVSKLGNPRLEV